MRARIMRACILALDLLLLHRSNTKYCPEGPTGLEGYTPKNAEAFIKQLLL